MALAIWSKSKRDQQLPQVGEIVYPHFTPKRYGKIIEVMPRKDTGSNPYDADLKVLWKDGTVTTEWSIHVNSLSALLIETERKAETHRKNLKAAEALSV
jgi:hypothetical protein